MDTFEHIWALLNPQGEFKRRRQACQRLWNGYSIEQQRHIYAVISSRKARGEFVNPNPYFAIEDNAEQPIEQLTFKEYYARFGTTEEQGGWKMTNPTGNKVIYVKQTSLTPALP